MTAACAFKAHPPLTFGMYQPPHEAAQSAEGKAIEFRFQAIKNSIGKTHEAYIVANDTYKTSLISRVLFNCGMYASFSYIAKKTRLEEEELRRLLNNNEQFRKSVMRTKRGEEMYIPNTPCSAIKDYIAAFRYLCALRT